MSTATVCDGPNCHEKKAENAAWIELVEDSEMYDFHCADCLSRWVNGWVDEEIPESMRETVEVTLRGRVIGTNRDLGHLFFEGCDAKSGHHPWVYRLHWATEVTPV